MSKKNGLTILFSFTPSHSEPICKTNTPFSVFFFPSVRRLKQDCVLGHMF